MADYTTTTRWRVPGGRFHNNNNILSSTTLASSMYSMHIYIYIIINTTLATLAPLVALFIILSIATMMY